MLVWQPLLQARLVLRSPNEQGSVEGELISLPLSAWLNRWGGTLALALMVRGGTAQIQFDSMILQALAGGPPLVGLGGWECTCG